MSQIPSNVALSAAQVTHNARQLAGQKDARAHQTQRLARDSADTFEHRVFAAGSANDPGAELPDRQAPGYEQLYLQDEHGQPLVPPPPESSPESPPEDTAIANQGDQPETPPVLDANDLAQLYQQVTGRVLQPTLQSSLDVTG